MDGIKPQSRSADLSTSQAPWGFLRVSHDKQKEFKIFSTSEEEMLYSTLGSVMHAKKKIIKSVKWPWVACRQPLNLRIWKAKKNQSHSDPKFYTKQVLYENKWATDASLMFSCNLFSVRFMAACFRKHKQMHQVDIFTSSSYIFISLFHHVSEAEWTVLSGEGFTSD